MKTQRSDMSKAQQLQQFLQEAQEHFPDLLALDGVIAWNTLFPDRPVLFGLRAVWRRKQVDLAALRALRAAAPLDLPLYTESERGQLAAGLLSGGDVLADTVLIAWIRGRTSEERRLLKEQVELLYPQINLPGYRAIATEARRLGWPTHFRGDLDRDLKTLCTPDAPKRFWWGVRSTGTDLYLPNMLFDVEWALARKKQGPDEQHYYSYNGERLRSIPLDTLIPQLARALNVESYEQAQGTACTALALAVETRFRNVETAKTYYEALQASKQAEEALRKVKRFKQQYS